MQVSFDDKKDDEGEIEYDGESEDDPGEDGPGVPHSRLVIHLHLLQGRIVRIARTALSNHSI